MSFDFNIPSASFDPIVPSHVLQYFTRPYEIFLL
jgi:hypothetical protein